MDAAEAERLQPVFLGCQCASHEEPLIPQLKLDIIAG
jgi:hypothetical protein